MTLRTTLVAALLLLCACSGGHQAEYDAALKDLAAFESKVDEGFEAARSRHENILGEAAWETPLALVASLQSATLAMGQVVADQKARIERERAILDLKAMDNAPATRELYHLDLKTQHAKLAIFQIFQEMYGDLLTQVKAGDPAAFSELAKIYREGVGAANRRYVELDEARQRRQADLLGDQVDAQAAPI
jgi:hypothetical protein